MDPFGVLASWKAKVLATEAKAVQNDWYNGLFILDADQVELLKFIGSVSLIGLTLFLVLRFVFLRHLSADFSNRVVSIMHNFVALSYSAYLVNWSAPFAEGPWPPSSAASSTRTRCPWRRRTATTPWSSPAGGTPTLGST